MALVKSTILASMLEAYKLKFRESQDPILQLNDPITPIPTICWLAQSDPEPAQPFAFPHVVQWFQFNAYAIEPGPIPSEGERIKNTVVSYWCFFDEALDDSTKEERTRYFILDDEDNLASPSGLVGIFIRKPYVRKDISHETLQGLTEEDLELMRNPGILNFTNPEDDTWLTTARYIELSFIQVDEDSIVDGRSSQRTSAAKPIVYFPDPNDRITRIAKDFNEFSADGVVDDFKDIFSAVTDAIVDGITSSAEAVVPSSIAGRGLQTSTAVGNPTNEPSSEKTLEIR